MESDHKKFAEECHTLLETKRKEGIEEYATCLVSKMRECQKEWLEKKFSLLDFNTRWKPIFLASTPFHPHQRCFTEMEFQHLVPLIVFRQKNNPDGFAHYLLRYRIDESSSQDEKAKTMIIHEIEREKHRREMQEMTKTAEES